MNAVLPTILDTPANRRDMPGADTKQWVRPEAAAAVIAFLLSTHSRAISGEGIRLSEVTGTKCGGARLARAAGARFA